MDNGNNLNPIIYLYFHSKILEWKGSKLSPRNFMICLAQWRIPKSLRYSVMKDMESFGLLEIRSRYSVELKENYQEFSNKVIPKYFKDKNTKEESPYRPYEELI